MQFSLFLSDLSLLEQITLDIYISITFLGVFYSLQTYLKLFTFSLNVECVGFVLRLQNASLFANPFFIPDKKCGQASN